MTVATLAAAPRGRAPGSSIRSETRPTRAGMTTTAAAIARRIRRLSTHFGSVTNVRRNVPKPGAASDMSATIHSTEPKATIDR